MNDRDFLIFIHNRLHNVHRESELVDYMHRLRAIITTIPEDQYTPSDGRGQNGIKEMIDFLNKQKQA